VEGQEKAIRMIQTQSQNEEIRQFEYKVGHEVRYKAGDKVRYQVFWDVGDKVKDEVKRKVKRKVWRKLFK
jgi:hypothetical protein